MNSVFGQSCLAFDIIEYFANFQFLNIKSVIYRPGYDKPTKNYAHCSALHECRKQQNIQGNPYQSTS